MKTLKKAESNKSLQQARMRALESVAGQVHGKTVEIIDSITPEDMESGLIKKTDKEGNLVAVKAYGPSLLQKVTSAAILTDKLKVIEETKKAILMDGGTTTNALPLPDTIQESLAVLGQKVANLRIIDVQFANKNQEVVSKVQEVAHAASLHEDIEEADYEDLDFDNP